MQAYAAAKDFLDAPAAQGVGCILLDVNMPGMTGPELHDHLHQLGIGLPVIYLTGQASVPVSVQAMKKGAIDFLEKTLVIKFLTISDPHADGTRSVFFELNGQPRDVTIADKSLESVSLKREQADPANPKQVGANMPGMVVTVAVKTGDKIAKGQKLFTLEAMKMETTISSEVAGVVEKILVKPGSSVEAGDLLLTVG